MARGPRRLKVTQGTDQANDGTQQYFVNPNDGCITVPADIAERLLHGGGFVDVTDPPPPVPAGLVKVNHPCATGCSWGGQSYTPNEAGHFLVPIAAEADLASHGFERVPDTSAADEAQPEPEAEAEAVIDEGGEPAAEGDAEAEAAQPAAESEPEAEAEA